MDLRAAHDHVPQSESCTGEPGGERGRPAVQANTDDGSGSSNER